MGFKVAGFSNVTLAIEDALIGYFSEF
jgi:hypothetical protein